MLLYFEGLDKSGKSTLARIVSDALSIPIYRKIPPARLPDEEHHAFFKGVGFALVELHAKYSFDAIVDRSFISDWVYSGSARGCNLAWEIWEEWEARHQGQAVMIIYVSTKRDVIAERLRRDPDKYLQEGDIEKHESFYQQYLKQTSFPVIRVSGHGCVEDQVSAILTGINSCKITKNGHTDNERKNN